MISRRGLFRLVAAAYLARFAPTPAHRAIAMPVHGLFNPSADIARQFRSGQLRDRETGIAIRFIQHYDIDADRLPSRLDVRFHPDAFALAMAPLLEAQRADLLFGNQLPATSCRVVG